MTETLRESYKMAQPSYPNRSRVWAANHFAVESPSKIPNWWHRLWQRALLGWHWEEIG